MRSSVRPFFHAAIAVRVAAVNGSGNSFNRVGSSRLFDLTRELDVPIAYFFEEMEAGVAEKSPSRLMRVPASKMQKAAVEPDPLAKRETLELVCAYYKITEPRVRKRMFELTKAIAKAAG